MNPSDIAIESVDFDSTVPASDPVQSIVVTASNTDDTVPTTDVDRCHEGLDGGAVEAIVSVDQQKIWDEGHCFVSGVVEEEWPITVPVDGFEEGTHTLAVTFTLPSSGQEIGVRQGDFEIVSDTGSGGNGDTGGTDGAERGVVGLALLGALLLWEKDRDTGDS